MYGYLSASGGKPGLFHMVYRPLCGVDLRVLSIKLVLDRDFAIMKPCLKLLTQVYLCVTIFVSFDSLDTSSQAAFPNWTQLGPIFAQPGPNWGPTGAQLGPIWNAA